MIWNEHCRKLTRFYSLSHSYHSHQATRGNSFWRERSMTIIWSTPLFYLEATLLLILSIFSQGHDILESRQCREIQPIPNGSIDSRFCKLKTLFNNNNRGAMIFFFLPDVGQREQGVDHMFLFSSALKP